MKLPKWIENKPGKVKQGDSSQISEESDAANLPDSAKESVEAAEPSGVKPGSPVLTTPLGILANKMGYSTGDKINDFFLHSKVLNSDEVAFYNELSLKAEELLHELSDEEEHVDEGNKAPKVHDMQIKVFISRDQMKAYGFFIPAVGGGRKLTLEELKASIEREGILFGVNEELLTQVFNE